MLFAMQENSLFSPAVCGDIGYWKDPQKGGNDLYTGDREERAGDQHVNG